MIRVATANEGYINNLTHEANYLLHNGTALITQIQITFAKDNNVKWRYIYWLKLKCKQLSHADKLRRNFVTHFDTNLGGSRFWGFRRLCTRCWRGRPTWPAGGTPSQSAGPGSTSWCRHAQFRCAASRTGGPPPCPPASCWRPRCKIRGIFLNFLNFGQEMFEPTAIP